MLKQNQNFLHPYFGIGTVKAVEKREILGQTTRVAVCVFPQRNDLELMLNLEAGEGLLRPLIKKNLVPQVLDHLQSYQPGDQTTRWHIRKEAYSKKLKGGDIFASCEVLKELYGTASKRDLSFWEREMLTTTRAVLVAELAHVSGLDVPKLLGQVDQYARYTN